MSTSNWYEISITQLLFAGGLIENDKLKKTLANVAKDYDNNSALLAKPLSEVFAKINERLRLYGMEIKTVVMKTDNVFRYYHGIANTEVNKTYELTAPSYHA